jgi:hypothetical protein
VFRVQAKQVISSALPVRPLGQTIAHRNPRRYGICMSQWLSTPALDQVAQKWRVLAERRRADFVELYRSGRWKRYYTEEQFLRGMREAMRASERWAAIAPTPERVASAQTPRSSAKSGRRTAA